MHQRVLKFESYNMFGSLTQIQFSVFEFRKWWARSLVLLFGNCFLCLNLNTNAVLTLLKSTIQKTSFCCFHLLNSVLSNIKIFSLSLQQKIPLSSTAIFSVSLSHDACSLSVGYGEWRSSNSRQSRENHRHRLSKQIQRPTWDSMRRTLLLSLPAMIWSPTILKGLYFL